MIHPHQIIVPQIVSTLRTLGEFPVAVDGTITKLWFKTDIASSGAVQIQFELNGVLMHTINVGSGLDEYEADELEYEVEARDTIKIKCTGLPPFGSFGPRSYFQVNVEDGLGIGPTRWEFQDGVSAPFASGVEGEVYVSTEDGRVYRSDGEDEYGWPLRTAFVPQGGNEGQALIKASNNDFDTEWGDVEAGGGGGGGGGIETDVFSVDVPYETPSPEDEEFTDGTLDPKWTVRNSLPYTLVDGHFFKPAATSTNLGAIHQPWTPTANRSWVMKISLQPFGVGAGNWIGFFFRASNTSGYTRRSLAIRYNGSTFGVVQSIWTDANVETFTSGATTQISVGSPIYLRADYDHASLNLLFYISRDGMTWHFITSTTAPGGQFPLSAAPTEVGIASWGGVPTSDIKVDWLRAIQGSTVGGSITGLQGLQGDAGPAIFGVAASDETSDLTTGTAKVIMHVPAAFTLGSIWAGLSTASSSGAVQVNVKKNGTTIFTTQITIDANEKTSLTAAVPAVLTGAIVFAVGDEIQVDIVAAGTGAKGLKVYFGE